MPVNADTRLAIERGILSALLLGGSFGMVSLAMTNAHAAQFFTPVIAFVGPLCGSTVQWWFRINGTVQEHQDIAKLNQSQVKVG